MGDEYKCREAVAQACEDLSRKLPGNVRILVGVFYEVEGRVEMEAMSNTTDGPELARCLLFWLAGPRRLDG